MEILDTGREKKFGSSKNLKGSNNWLDQVPEKVSRKQSSFKMIGEESQEPMFAQGRAVKESGLTEDSVQHHKREL